MRIGLCLVPPVLLAVVALAQAKWTTVEPKGPPFKRHEHAFVKVGEKFYALGGRRVQPVDVFDPKTEVWSMGKRPPLELHHFQALEYEGKVLVAGAFTGRFPGETPVENFYFYDPATDGWSEGPEIPEDRRRGSSGAFLKDGKLYLVCGLRDGHRSGWVPWFDEYDFESKRWRRLPDAPRARDHFQAVLIGGKLVLAGGRRSGEGGKVFTSVIKEVDVYDFETGVWETMAEGIPTPRAGTMSLALGEEVLVIGGESERKKAHSEVEALNVATGEWRDLPALPVGRHATQPILHEGSIYLQAGSVTRGGTETSSMLRLPLAE
ncbi:MAG: Kelch repeat-containing protein [Verrucomicrobiaceae bacterium]